MSRLFPLRILLALWFVLSVGEPSVLRACPMHASAAAELASERDMAGMAMSGHDGTHESRSSGSHQHAHHCNCVNCCVGCSSAALHSARADVIAPASFAWTSGEYPTPAAAPRASARYLLPPGTGPPRVQA